MVVSSTKFRTGLRKQDFLHSANKIHGKFTVSRGKKNDREIPFLEYIFALNY